MVWHSGHASVPSGSHRLHCGQLWIGSGGAMVGAGVVAELRSVNLGL
jgi:hypothetical protein